MFSTIFKQELKYWFSRPAFYIYISIFLLLAFFLSAATAGFFDSVTATTGSSRIVNSPIGLSGLFNALTIFIFFLFPSIVGVSIFRDYKSEMHTILYSYPFTKANYLFAKFFSSIVIVSLIVFSIALGMIIGFRFPGTNPDIVGPFNAVTYLQTYFIFILPNVLLFGAIVFAVVAFTRNIAAGFITVIILMFGQGVLESLLSEPEHRTLAAILDPFGAAASNYYTKYWTPSEQNELQIPIKEMIIYNRLLWLAVSVLIFGFVYRFFKFSQNAVSFSFRKPKGERVTKTNFSGITRITLPKVSYNFSFLQNLKTTWKLSNIDFKYIVKSWAFISIVLVGLVLMIVGLSEIGNIFGTATLPVTWKMLNVGGVFSASINICTFLYAGMLVHRAKIAKINHLVDATPIPNWTLLLSKLIALIKMQLVLLAVIMVSGMLFQMYKGYYNFEIAHYITELFFLNFLSFLIWALLSIFIQTLIGNPYLGLFVLLVISIGMPFLSLAGIEQSIFKYNQGPRFSYSDMNGYGILTPYLAYKTYWILGGLVLLIASFLFWVRGIPSSFLERISIAKSRFKGFAAISFGVFLIAFLGLGYSIYQETGAKGKKTSSKEAELQSVKWEKTYKKYEVYAQPRIVSVITDVNIFPKERLFNASATYIMVNKTDKAIDSLFLNHNSLESTFEFNKPNKLVLEDTIQHFDIYSCFPIVVSEAKRALDIKENDSRSMTQTGGLPFFGGPGNNYSMHAVASLVENLRKDSGSFGLVYANGGWMSKHSVGIYSTQPIEGEWKSSDSTTFQAEVDRKPVAKINRNPNGEAILETYTIHYYKGFPVKAIIIGRLKETNERFYAATLMADKKTVQILAKQDCLESTIFVETDPQGNRFAFKKEDLATFRPKVIDTFQEEYKFETRAYKNRAFIHDELKKESANLAETEKVFIHSHLDAKLEDS